MERKSLGGVIKELRIAAKLSQGELAEADGVELDAGNLSRFERNLQSIALPKLEAIASRLGISMSEVFRRVESRISEPSAEHNVGAAPDFRWRLPVISWVQAGGFNNLADPYQPGDAGEWVDVPKPFSKRAFALRVRGDSMMDPSGNGDSFPDGAIICVEPEAQSRHKSYVVVRLEASKEATFKQLIIDGSETYLKPLNPRYPVIKITEEATICGVVRQMVMNFTA